MTTNITTLALNLLISERLHHRGVIADKIVEILQQSNDVSEGEQELKNNFLALMMECVENPNRNVRDLFYKMAQYYNMKIHGVSGDVAIAA
jgi:GTPase SAR1 family protein